MNVETQEWAVRLIVAGILVFIAAKIVDMVRRALAGHLSHWYLKRGKVGRAMYWKNLSGYPRGGRNA